MCICVYNAPISFAYHTNLLSLWEVHASVGWEISNCHLILFNGIERAKGDVVD